MLFNRFLLSVESRDLSQVDKILIIGSSFIKLGSDDKIYNCTNKKSYLEVVERQKKKFCYPSLSFGKEDTLIRILSA